MPPAYSVPPGNATSFNPNAANTVRALALFGSTLGAGGDFNSVGGTSRNNLAAVDLSTGNVTSFDPSPGNVVLALALSADGSTLYVGGNFGTIANVPRSELAAISTANGTATSFNANTSVNTQVLALALSGDGATLYAGGTFTSIGGQTRNYIAGLSSSTGTATSFNPNANNYVSSLSLSSDGSRLYAGGQFTSIGGQTRNDVAALSTADGTAVTTFNPNANGLVEAVALSGDGATLYVGGFFTSIGGQTRNDIAGMSTADGTAVAAFDPNANNAVFALALSGDGATLYASGNFTAIGGQTRTDIAGLATANAKATSFNPSTNASANALIAPASGSALYAGGGFTTIGGQTRQGFAYFPHRPTTTIDSHPGNPTTSTSATFAFSSTDASSTFQCKLDSGSYSPCTSPQSYSGLASGSHTFRVEATLNGITEAIPPSFTWGILSLDGSGTLTTSTSGVSASAIHRTISFTYTAAPGGTSNGTVTLGVPTGWSPPSTTGTDPGYTTASVGSVSVASQTVTVSGVSQLGGQKLTIVYGSKASAGPGATAPNTTGSKAWSATEKSTSTGTLTALAASPQITVYAPDGSGTLTTPTTGVSASSASHTITFTDTTAPGGIANGAVRLVVPSGWSPPSLTGSDPGYTTATVGTMAVSGQTITISALTRAAGQTFAITYGSKSFGGPGAKAPSATGPQTWQAREKSVPGGTLTTLGSSPQIRVYAPNGSGTLTTPTTSVVHSTTGDTITFTYTAASGGLLNGSVRLAVPAGWSPPSLTGTAPGFVTANHGVVSVSSRTIVVSGLTLAAGQTVTITYGAKVNGGPGASAPSTAVGSQTWQAKENSTSAGTATGLAASPAITVT